MNLWTLQVSKKFLLHGLFKNIVGLYVREGILNLLIMGLYIVSAAWLSVGMDHNLKRNDCAQESWILNLWAPAWTGTHVKTSVWGII